VIEGKLLENVEEKDHVQGLEKEYEFSHLRPRPLKADLRHGAFFRRLAEDLRIFLERSMMLKASG